MKHYARQVNPEYQESPILQDEFAFYNIAVCGNDFLNEHCPEIFTKVRNVLRSGDIPFEAHPESVINDLLPPFERGSYSNEEIGELARIAALDWSWTGGKLCAVLTIVTGKPWEHRTIQGCSQSDWNEIYFPSNEWSKKALDTFEIEYFNNGSEWIIDGYSVYVLDERNARKEIADAIGYDPNSIVLLGFDGYERIPKYKEV